jgi:hypothetical protein
VLGVLRSALSAACLLAAVLAPAAGSADAPTEVLADRCRMACRAEKTPSDVCAQRCPCVAQGFALGLSADELPRWIAALDQPAPSSDEARKRWDAAQKGCSELQSSGALY